jgi:protocatechuate 3,4-dioxygenase beta subunit
MKSKLISNRRSFLKMGAGTAASALLIPTVSHALGEVCGPTPAQTPGPFYPGENKFSVENDLTVVNGKKATGQVIYVTGIVQDAACKPVVGANVEIWQACESGKYNNPNDPNTAPLDPNFKYWAEVFTDSKGAYIFKSILPGAYPADTDWIRPPHIHFKISKLGYKDLVTQLYFGGEKLNETDLILQQVPAGERDSVIVDFKPSGKDMEPNSLTGVFNITMNSVRK